jgi:hypothetical protein
MGEFFSEGGKLGKAKGYASKGDRGKLQETMSKDCPLGMAKACGERRQDAYALYGAMRNVLELCRELTEKAFFLRFREGNAGRVTRVLNGLLRGDKASLNQFIQAGIDRTHSVSTPNFHYANDLLHPSSS